MDDQVSRPSARVLADVITEIEQRGSGVSGILRRLEFPVLATGGGLSAERAETTALYPIGALAKARVMIGWAPQIRIGRAEASEVLILSDLSVSKRHAMLIHLGEDAWSLANLGRAATRVEGRALEPNEQVPIDAPAFTFEVGEGREFTFLRRKGFAIQLKKLLAGRTGAQLATTTVDAADETDDSDMNETAQTIVRAAGPARASRRFKVVLEDSLLEEASNWDDFLDLVDELGDQIVQVEATVGGEQQVLFDRDG